MLNLQQPKMKKCLKGHFTSLKKEPFARYDSDGLSSGINLFCNECNVHFSATDGYYRCND